MTADRLAENEYRDHVIYRELAAHERIPEFKRILERLAAHELEHHRFWLTLGTAKSFRVGRSTIATVKLARRILGLTFITKLLERREQKMKASYAAILEEQGLDASVKARVRSFMTEEGEDEAALIGEIKEERIEFISNIVLGLNDGLIELTGALTGFAFALTDPAAVALTGSITGIAASLSMASSAYMQARHDPERMATAKKSGLYTGIAYFIVVALLIAPFLMLTNITTALTVMFGTVMLIIAAISFYTSVLFARKFAKQFGEMFLFSAGVALITFIIGSLFRRVTGIEIG